MFHQHGYSFSFPAYFIQALPGAYFNINIITIETLWCKFPVRPTWWRSPGWARLRWRRHRRSAGRRGRQSAERCTWSTPGSAAPAGGLVGRDKRRQTVILSASHRASVLVANPAVRSLSCPESAPDHLLASWPRRSTWQAEPGVSCRPVRVQKPSRTPIFGGKAHPNTKARVNALTTYLYRSQQNRQVKVYTNTTQNKERHRY